MSSDKGQAIGGSFKEGTRDRESFPIKISTIKLVNKARKGNPGALRELFRELLAFLRGECELQPVTRRFMVEALDEIVTAPKVWEQAERDFEQLDRSQNSFIEQVTNRGPRISEANQRKLGRVFCKAFHLSKPGGKLKDGEVPKHPGFTPTSVDKFRALRCHGVARKKALKMVASAYSNCSERDLDSWVRARKIEKPEPDTGRSGGGDLIANCLRMAVRVLRARKVEEKSLRAAEEMVAEGVAKEIFPDTRFPIEKWADSVLGEPLNHLAEHLEIAERVDESWRNDKEAPEVPPHILAQIGPVLEDLEKSKTLLPSESITQLVKAVQAARRFEHEYRKKDPRWAGVWAYLEERFARPR